MSETPRDLKRRRNEVADDELSASDRSTLRLLSRVSALNRATRDSRGRRGAVFVGDISSDAFIDALGESLQDSVKGRLHSGSRMIEAEVSTTSLQSSRLPAVDVQKPEASVHPPEAAVHPPDASVHPPEAAIHPASVHPPEAAIHPPEAPVHRPTDCTVTKSDKEIPESASAAIPETDTTDKMSTAVCAVAGSKDPDETTTPGVDDDDL